MMANWVHIGGGIGRGISEGINDLQGMERQVWLRNQEEFAAKQRAQQEAEMAEEAAVREQIGRVPTSRSEYYNPESAGEFLDNDGNPTMGIRKAARPVYDIQADQAAIYAGSANPRLAQFGNSLAQSARQGREDVRAQSVRGAQEKALAAHAARVKAVMAGDLFASVPQMVEYYNQKVPDGFQALFSGRADGGANIAFVEEKTGKVVSSKALTPAQAKQLAIQASKDMLEHEMSTLGGVEGYNQAHKRGIDQEKLAIDRGELGIKQGEFGLREAAAPAQRGLTEAQTRYYNRMPRAASGRDHAPAWQVVGPDVDGVLVSFDRTTNTLARVDGKPVQNPKAFAKLSGEREAPAVDPKRREAAERAYAEAIGDAKRLKEVRAAYPDIFGLDPRYEKYGALGPDTEEKKPAEKKKPVDKKTSEAKGIYNRFRQQTPEERMSSMTHK